MTDREWDQFFGLLEKIVDMPGKTLNEKIAEVKTRAKDGEYNAEMNLEEFLSWNFGYDD